MSIEGVKEYLANKYEFIQLIGKGGFAEVYLAKDKLLERKVAIKILLSQFATEPDTVERFIREARLYARMDHKNLIPVYDTGIIEDKGKNAFIIMKYIKGESLRTRQEREGKLPIDMIRTVIKEIASALEYIHSQGIIHRDIKPGNILTEEGTQNLYLADFGIARADTGSTLTQSGLIVGTPNYISPEQIKGKRIDSRADLYAFGAMLYELITGKPIFTGDSSMQILYKHVNEEPEPLDSHMPHVPGEIQYIVSRCLEKDPDKRFQAAGEILEILDSKRATFISRYLQAREKALQQKTGKRKHVFGKIAAVFLLVIITTAVVLILNKEKGVEIISKKEESPKETRAKTPVKTEELLPKTKTEIGMEDKEKEDKKEKETPSVQEKQKLPIDLKKEKGTKEKIKVEFKKTVTIITIVFFTLTVTLFSGSYSMLFSHPKNPQKSEEELEHEIARLLKEADESYQNGQFKRAIEIYQSVIQRLNEKKELVKTKQKLLQIMVSPALTHFTIRENDKARAQLEKLLALNPHQELDPEYYPPKFINLFDEAKKNVLASLEITSEPPEADIYINDKKVGKTPFKKEKFVAGDYRLKAQLKGYTAKEEQVTVKVEPTIVFRDFINTDETIIRRLINSVSIIEVSGLPNVIEKLDYEVIIEHPSIQDLTVSLLGTDNRTTFFLWNRQSQAGDSHRLTGSGTTFNAINPNGQWKLVVTNHGNVLGRIVQWSLRIHYKQ